MALFFGWFSKFNWKYLNFIFCCFFKSFFMLFSRYFLHQLRNSKWKIQCLNRYKFNQYFVARCNGLLENLYKVCSWCLHWVACKLECVLDFACIFTIAQLWFSPLLSLLSSLLFSSLFSLQLYTFQFVLFTTSTSSWAFLFFPFSWFVFSLISYVSYLPTELLFLQLEFMLIIKWLLFLHFSQYFTFYICTDFMSIKKNFLATSNTVQTAWLSKLI